MTPTIAPPTRTPTTGPERLNRRGALDRADTRRPPAATVLALVLACLALIALDASTGDGSPVDGLRRVAGEVYGPAETATDRAIAPVVAIPGWLRSRQDMRQDLDRLELENSQLQSEAATNGYDANRLAAYDALIATAAGIGYAVVPARVVGIGATESFSRTVTIDAGSSSGLRADLTVVSGDGLVGRVLRVTRTTATVLLVVDPDSVVGGRVGRTMEVGFLHGRGSLGRAGRLDLELVDQTALPARNDAVVTWGSDRGAPYVSGVPVGRVTAVWSSVRQGTQRVEIEPYVDFGSLDLVGVVVPSGTTSDRAVIEADGSLR